MNDLGRDPKQIGNSIQRARKARRWTQQMLAERVGMRQETISLVETGNPAARVDTILAILAALDLEFQVAPRTKVSRPQHLKDRI
jgi:HTH-type transcriptional regulator/antitoxin HipB